MVLDIIAQFDCGVVVMELNGMVLDTVIEVQFGLVDQGLQFLSRISWLRLNCSLRSGKLDGIVLHIFFEIRMVETMLEDMEVPELEMVVERVASGVCKSWCSSRSY
jgi:hypothetical protein